MTTDTPVVDWKLSEHDAGVLLRLLNLQAGQADPVWQPYWQQQVATLKAAMEETGQVVHRRMAAARRQGNGHVKQPLPTLPVPADLEHQVAELTRANHDYQAEITRLKAALSFETVQRQQAEANLKVETERLRLLFEFAPDAYYINDLSGKFLAGNRAAEEITGYSREELIGQNFLETNLLSPEEAVKAVANLATGALGQATGPDEFTLTRRDGNRVTVEIRTYPVIVAGQTMVLGIARDITGRKRAETALQEREAQLRISEQRLRTVVTNAPVVLFAVDRQGIFTLSEGRGLAGLGLQPGQAVGHSLSELYGDSPQVMAAAQRAFAGDMSIGQVDLAGRTFETHYAPLHDEAGQVTSIIGVGIDVTERRQAELALRESEMRYRYLADHIADVVWILDLQTLRFSYVSPSVQRLRGYTVDEVLAQSMEQALAPASLAMVQANMGRRIAAYLAGDPDAVTQTHEVEKPCRGGTTVWTETVTTLLGDTETNLRILGVSRDITGRKQVEAALRASEKRYRAIVEDQADLICRFGPDRRLTFVNEAYCRYFGRNRDDLVGRPFTPLIPPEHQAFVAQQISSVTPDHPLVTYEHRVIRPDGTIAWQQWSDRAIFDEQDGLIEIQSVGRDITERKQAEVTLQENNRCLEIAMAELKVTQAHLVQQERLAAVGQVAAGIAHEFNNILTSMLGFAELLQVAPDTPEQIRTDLAYIIQPGRRAAHLVRQLLDFSRKSLRRPQPLDLGCFIPETVEFLHHALAEDIQVCLAVDPGLYRVEADPTQLQQMLANLVFNARDAMPGGGTLRVRLTRREVQAEASCMGCHQPITGDWICLAVMDTGSGIPAEVLPHIFEPFFTTKQVGQGTGLGLPQVLGIVHQHAGHITVTSRVDQGTTFAIYWPPAKDAG